MLEWSTDLAYWLFEQIFRPLTSVKRWRMVRLLPKVLCFLSQLARILISGCISCSNLPFQSFIWRNVARTVNRFGLLPFEKIFRPLTSVKGWKMVEMLPRVLCFLSVLTWILISCCNFPSYSLFLSLSEEMVLKRSTDLACWPQLKSCWPLISVKGWRMIEMLSRVLCYKPNLCWPFKQIFRPLTSVRGWRIVKLLSRVLDFLS